MALQNPLSTIHVSPAEATPLHLVGSQLAAEINIPHSLPSQRFLVVTTRRLGGGASWGRQAMSPQRELP